MGRRRLADEDEEATGIRLPGLVIAFVLLIGAVTLLIWIGPRVAPAEAAQDGSSDGLGAEAEAVDPFASVPDELPPPPRNVSPLAGLATLTDSPAWVDALAYIELGEERSAAAYPRLEELGQAAVKSDGYAARLGFLKALEATAEIAPYLEELRAESADAQVMLQLRAAWKKKVSAIDHDFGLIPRD